MKLRQARDIWLAAPGPLRLSAVICAAWLAFKFLLVLARALMGL